MELKDIASVLEGDFVLCKRGYGRVKGEDGETILFNTELIQEGAQELPLGWLRKKIIIKSLTWSKSLVEVIDDD